MSDARSDDQVIRLQIAAVKMDELDRLRAEVSELRNCAVLCDQENDRLRSQVRELQAAQEEDDKVQAECDEELVWLRANCSRLVQENDRLRGRNERLRDELVALQAKADTLHPENALLHAIGQKSIETIEWQRREKEVLRELVREAYEETERVGCLGLDWEERAEKALGNADH